MGLDNFYKTLTKQPFETGSFTNHGFLVRAAEQHFNSLSKNYLSSVVGSRLIGSIITFLVLRNYHIQISGMTSHQYDLITNFVGTKNFLNQKAIFVDNKRNLFPQRQVVKRILFVESIQKKQLASLLIDEIYDVIIVHALVSTNYPVIVHKNIDYSVLLFRDSKLYKESTNLRSSYGAEKLNEDVFATMNGRPSEIIGNLLVKTLTDDDTIECN